MITFDIKKLDERRALLTASQDVDSSILDGLGLLGGNVTGWIAEITLIGWVAHELAALGYGVTVEGKLVNLGDKP